MTDSKNNRNEVESNSSELRAHLDTDGNGSADATNLARIIIETADEAYCLISGKDDCVVAFNRQLAVFFRFSPRWLGQHPTSLSLGQAIYKRERHRLFEDVSDKLDRLTMWLQSPKSSEIEIDLVDGRSLVGISQNVATGERLYTFRDVTRERRMLRELEAERTRLSRMVEHAPVAYYVIDCETNAVIEISRSIGNLTGQLVSAFLGQSPGWEENVHPLDLPLLRGIRRQAIARRRPFDIQYRRYHVDGSIRWFREMAEIIPGLDNMQPQMAGVLIDITQRRAAESDLRESEKRFRELIEGIPDLIFYEHDISRKLTYVSPSVSRILGFEPNDLVGHTFGEAYDKPGHEDLDKARQAVLAAVTSRRRQPTYETNLKTQSGANVVLEVMEYPFINDQEVAGVRGVARDVTPVRDMERRLRERERLAVLGTFAGGLAHDLNNLLLPIRAMLETIEHDPEPGRTKDRINSIRLATDHIGDLARKLLFWTREDSAGQSRAVVTDVTQWSKQTMTFLHEAIRGRSNESEIVLDSIINEPHQTARVDPDLLKQAVLNLVLNACDAISTGGSITLKVSQSPHGWTDHLDDAETASAAQAGSDPEDENTDSNAQNKHKLATRFAVSDTGCGMDEATMKRAFDPFFSTKARGKSTGLGLALVAAIIKSAGGAVHIDSQLGGGTTISIDVPVAIERIEKTVSKKTIGSAIISLDDPMMAAYVQSCLKQIGMTSRVDTQGEPDPQDMVWITEPNRLEQDGVLSTTSIHTAVTIVLMGNSEDWPNCPDHIQWATGAISPSLFGAILKDIISSKNRADI